VEAQTLPEVDNGEGDNGEKTHAVVGLPPYKPHAGEATSISPRSTGRSSSENAILDDDNGLTNYKITSTCRSLYNKRLDVLVVMTLHFRTVF